ncbi:MAG: hypothetical protein WCJ14_12910 [Verrucomicrobiota bacterium]
MNPKTIIASAVLLSATPAFAGSTLPSLTETQPVTTTDSGWRVSTAMYIWATDLSGDMTVHGQNVPVDLGFNQLIHHMDYAFMGIVEVGKGRWSLITDLFYAKLSTENSTNLANVESELQQFIGNFALAYRWVDTATTRFDTYAGARVNWMRTDVNITSNAGGTWSGSGDQAWVDPIIGVRFNHNLSEKFFFRALADIGGFGVSSDLTWQAMASVGYRVNENSSVALGYRALGTDYSHNDLTYDVISHGLLLGYEYKF